MDDQKQAEQVQDAAQQTGEASPPAAEDKPAPPPAPPPKRAKGARSTMIAIVSGVLIVGAFIAIVLWVMSREKGTRKFVLDEIDKAVG